MVQMLAGLFGYKSFIIYEKELTWVYYTEVESDKVKNYAARENMFAFLPSGELCMSYHQLPDQPNEEFEILKASLFDKIEPVTYN